MSGQHLLNLNILESHVYAALGKKVVLKVQSFFQNFLPKIDGFASISALPDNEVIILLLHFLVRYWPKREYGKSQ
jgi:hypothetical protein